MNKIFLGFIFIFFNFTLHLGFFSINVLPDFVGYILLYLGIKTMIKESKHFKDIEYISLIMAIIITIITVSFYLINTESNNIFNFIFEVILTVPILFIVYKIIMGIKSIETKEERNYNSNVLLSIWIAIIVIESFACVLKLVPALINATLLVILSIIIVIIFLAFTIIFYKTKKSYESYHTI